MTTEVGAGQSADDIQAVADSAWLNRVRSESNSEPVLDADGAVVISDTSGSGPILEGAPPDRNHQAAGSRLPPSPGWTSPLGQDISDERMS
jgi:hypothetical protein